MPGRPFASLRHLEGVASIRRLRSFSAAADAVALTQSALTQAVATLERRLGRRLFDRGARGARPTMWGDRLGEGVDRALDALDAAGADALAGADRRSRLSRRATVTQLAALAAVERAGSCRAGARAAGLTEASVHRAVRDLEASLGVDLLVGDPTGIRPTRAATVIARTARQTLAEIDRMLDAIGRGEGRLLTVGALSVARGGLLPSAIARLCARDPAARFAVREGGYPELLAALLDGTVDVLLAALREREPDGVTHRMAFDDDLMVVARHDHPLVRGTGWPFTALADHPWAVPPPGTPRRELWEDMCRAGGFEPPAPRVECGSAAVARGLLLQGDWLAMLSPDQFRLERESGLLAAVGGPVPRPSRRLGVLVRAGWRPDPGQAAFLDVLRELGGAPEDTLEDKMAR